MGSPSTERAISLFTERAKTSYSLEDLPTNWVGLYLGTMLKPSERPDAAMMEKICGKVLSREDALTLWDHMTQAEHDQKNFDVRPILFDLAAKGIRDAARYGDSSRSRIFDRMTTLTKRYREFAKVIKSEYRGRLGGGWRLTADGPKEP
jgi:hypothetical protein